MEKFQKKTTLGSKFEVPPPMPPPMPLLSQSKVSSAQVDFLRKECAVKQGLVEFLTGECVTLLKKLNASEKNQGADSCADLAGMLEEEFNKPLSTGFDFKEIVDATKLSVEDSKCLVLMLKFLKEVDLQGVKRWNVIKDPGQSGTLLFVPQNLRTEKVWGKYFQRHGNGKPVEVRGSLEEVARRPNVVVCKTPISFEELYMAKKMLDVKN